MTRREYIDALSTLTTEVSGLLDLLPHAALLESEQKIRAQGQMLRLKTALDHTVGLQGDDGYTALLRTAAVEALQAIDQVSWISEPDRKWYRAAFDALSDLDRYQNISPVAEELQ